MQMKLKKKKKTVEILIRLLQTGAAWLGSPLLVLTSLSQFLELLLYMNDLFTAVTAWLAEHPLFTQEVAGSNPDEFIFKSFEIVVASL